MNNKKVQHLYNQIVNAGQIYAVTEQEYISADFSDLTQDPDNEVIRFYWNNPDDAGNPGYTYEVIVNEAGIDAATVDPFNITLVDTEGEEFPIRLYALQRIAVNTDWE